MGVLVGVSITKGMALINCGKRVCWKTGTMELVRVGMVVVVLKQWG